MSALFFIKEGSKGSKYKDELRWQNHNLCWCVWGSDKKSFSHVKKSSPDWNSLSSIRTTAMDVCCPILAVVYSESTLQTLELITAPSQNVMHSCRDKGSMPAWGLAHFQQSTGWFSLHHCWSTASHIVSRRGLLWRHGCLKYQGWSAWLISPFPKR